MISTSIIIPTYNRPESLKNCILSILGQTVIPNEVVIIDDGNLSSVPLYKELSQAGVDCLYIKKDVPGLTESRNRGVSVSRGDIVFFLDDDVVLFNNFLEEILRIYYHDKEENIAGVGGLIANIPPLKWYEYIQNAYYILFLNKGIKEGRVLKSGFCTELGITEFRIKRVSRVDFLSGGACSYRRWVFEEFSFTDKYREVALGEDKDFSLRVSKKYSLVVNPLAK
ncbi:MAG: glycosyltransferase family 2 protein, partial [bacterium]